MEIKLTGISIRNFKSFEDAHVDLDQFNVLVGPNLSGKSNFIDVFRFLKEAFNLTTPYDPTTPWWGYNNLVFNKKENKLINFDFHLNINSLLVVYSISFGQEYGNFRLMDERLQIESIALFTRTKSGKIRIEYDRAFLESKKSEFVKRLLNDTIRYRYDEVKLPEDLNTLDSVFNGVFDETIAKMIFPYPSSQKKEKSIIIRINRSDIGEIQKIYDYQFTKEKFQDIIDRKEEVVILFPYNIIKLARNYLEDLITRNIILKNIDFPAIKQDKHSKFGLNLKESAENLVDILYRWSQDYAGKLPESFNIGLKRNFPNLRIKFDHSETGKVFLKIIEQNKEFSAPLISDGLIKFLSILAAIEFKPKLIIIDEVENSLHAKVIKYILDELRDLTETTVIITTHSPVVIDFTRLEDIKIVEKIHDSQIIAIKNIEKLKVRLNELGITHSDSLLNGPIKDFL
ncbi:MAG: AAA family ATPase [Candidatus Hodarchaeota archaeon]